MYSTFEADLAAAVADGRIAGAVALVADRDGVIYETAAGVRAAGQPTPMDADTLFGLASMTKAIASVAVLREVERGVLDLDADLAGLIPEFAALQVLEGFGEDGAPRLRPARGAVTLRQLLTHTSGFAYDFASPDLGRWSQATGAPNLMSGQRAAHLVPLLFDPGEQWAYGIGIDWAGVALEAATGQRLNTYLDQHIFQPLGMTDTGFQPTPAQAARRASVHMAGPEGGLFPLPASPLDGQGEPEVFSAGGGLVGTARDYARFLRMLLNGGSLEGASVLKPETIDLLSQIHTGELRAGAFKAASPGVTHDFDLFPDQRTGWGLATMVSPQAGPDGRSAGTLGWAGIFNTYYWADRDRGLAGILMTQQLPFADPGVLALLSSLERSAYGKA